jgi:hypothetical protein
MSSASTSSQDAENSTTLACAFGLSGYLVYLVCFIA